MSTPQQLAMKRHGFYDAHSAIQSAASALALATLRAAAARAPMPASPAPFAVADYGSSEGRNSLGPMKAVVEVVRGRSAAPICVFHVDRVDNDFSALFALVVNSPDSYRAGVADVFSAAVGGSFFGPVLPPGRMSVGWSALAVHWLSRVPAELPDHIWTPGADAHARAAFAAQARDDW